MKPTAKDLDPFMRVEVPIKDGMKQYDVLKDDCFTVLGLPFFRENHNFFRNSERYRARIEEVNKAINWLADNTAGAAITFKTNAKKIILKVKLNKPAYLWHMARTCEIGFDLYLSIDQRFRFLNVTRTEQNCAEYEAFLLENMGSEEKEILINFPLYSGVIELKILIDVEAEIIQYSRFKGKKWLFYGTSITQGGCASRPGMGYTNILSRHYERDIINLGYSGNGLGENIIAQMIGEISDLECVFIDYDANAGAIDTLRPTLEPFIRTLKEKKRDLKIIVISRVNQIKHLTEEYIRNKYMDCRCFEMEITDKLNLEYGGIFFIDGLKLFGEDFDEYTVDNVHFTDLGYYMFSKNLIPYIDQYLFNHGGEKDGKN